MTDPVRFESRRAAAASKRRLWSRYLDRISLRSAASTKCVSASPDGALEGVVARSGERSSQGRTAVGLYVGGGTYAGSARGSSTAASRIVSRSIGVIEPARISSAKWQAT
jgi:hypothetical protein